MKKVQCIITIGIAGAGKSTFVNMWAEGRPHYTVISSDKIREEIFGDESNQNNNELVFKILYNRAVSLLNSGENVIIDATNTNPIFRQQLIDYIRENTNDDVSIVGWVFPSTVENAVHNNKQRARKVPEAAIRKMHDSMVKYPPKKDEGFDVLVVMEVMPMFY